MIRSRTAAGLGALAAAALAVAAAFSGGDRPALAQGAAAGGDPLTVSVVYVTRTEPPRQPLSLVEPVLTDEGLQGARQAMADNQTTGRFLNQTYELIEAVLPEDGDVAAAVEGLLAEGRRLFVADLRMDDLLAVADLPGADEAVIFNARAQDDALRDDACRANVLHTIPSRAMKADALAQYLVWKRWTRWFLMHGTRPDDLALADALRRAATRFGARIVEERAYEYEPMAARTDTGHAQIQQQIPVLTQDVGDHDVLVVADESDVFGEYLPYRTWDPRPVAGTQGLVPTGWHRVHEQWGGTQMQRRFEAFAGRPMTERDHAAWLAVRGVGEAVTRTASADAGAIRDYLLGDAFGLAAFKGEALTFRAWDRQMRQPILLVTPRVLVSVSPQPGFLHQRTPLDTLGIDEPESGCDLG